MRGNSSGDRAKETVAVPTVKEVEAIKLPKELLPLDDRLGYRLFRLGISDVVIDGNARKGCSSCSGDKKKLCPLEIGYEKQKSFKESVSFVGSYKFAVLVLAAFPDESDRLTCKSIWEGLLKVEQHFNAEYNSARAFKFAMTCPFCLPKEFRLERGECVFPTFYRPLHEQYNINVTETLYQVFGDGKPTGVCSIILVS